MERKRSKEKLAIILSRIHAHNLIPFYTSEGLLADTEIPAAFENEWDGVNWEKLPERSLNADDLDKAFSEK